MPLSMLRGEKKIWQFTLTENGSPVNLASASIRFALRDNWPESSVTSDASAILQKSTASGSGIVITDGANGVFELTISHADTNTLTPKSYYFGIEYIPNGDTEPRGVPPDTLQIGYDVVRSI